MLRNQSMHDYFRKRGDNHRPRFRFNGSTRADWQNWRESLLPALKASLGRAPEVVPLNPELIAEWRDDGLIKQRILFDVEENLAAVAYIFRPERPAKAKLPAILCCHGHGPVGKEAVMGNRSTAEHVAAIAQCNYDYGLQMAKAGFVTIAIDWRGFGERDDRRKPNANPTQIPGQRDPCEVHGIRATLLGQTLLGLNLHDGRRALDLLCQQPFVDADRIGVMGLSFGGTMTTWFAMLDERIRAADIICYSDLFAAFGERDVNLCNSQITFGLFDLCDVPDLHGMIAPKPLLVEIGSYDECFRVDTAVKCFESARQIYTAAGAADRIELELFEGGHGWAGKKSFEFFRQNLSE